MRIILTVLSATICCALLMGVAGFEAPVMPSKSFYINDYANVLEWDKRDNLLEAAQRLEEKQGVREVVLTVEGFGEIDPGQYAKSIFDSWEIGAAGGVGVLILLCTGEKRIIVHSNMDIESTYSMKIADELAADGSFSEAVSLYFFEIAETLAGKDFAEINSVSGSNGGVSGNGESAPNTKNIGETETSARDDVFYMISFVLFLFIFMKALRTAFRYRKKYSNNKAYYRDYSPGYVYKRTPMRKSIIDDGEYPSGFGGLGNRKAIYGENIDEAEDIGIIKRNYGNDIDEGSRDSEDS